MNEEIRKQLQYLTYNHGGIKIVSAYDIIRMVHVVQIACGKLFQNALIIVEQKADEFDLDKAITLLYNEVCSNGNPRITL